MGNLEPQFPVLFFDGVCGLCNGFVDFMMRRDRTRRFRFATLQGATAQGLLPAAQRETLDSFILWRSGSLSARSDAVLRSVAALGGLWTAVGILMLIPRPIRDWVYNWVARNRYRWFGKKEVCRLPTPEERNYFLP